MSSTTMTVARLHGIGDVRVEHLPIPEPSTGEIVVRVEACGICATDARKYAIGVNDGTYPFNPGHEWVGHVAAVGDGVDGWSVGQRAYGDTYGGYGEYAAVGVKPSGWSRGAVALDEAVPLERAVFLEPLADCVHGVRDQARVVAGDRVVVFSAGSMGLQIAGVALRAGAEVLVVEPRADRRERAIAFGVSHATDPGSWKSDVSDWTDGRGFDAAIVALGSVAVASDVIASAAPGGRIVLFAGFGDHPMATVDFNTVHYKELSIVGSEWIGTPPNQRWECYDEAQRIIESGELPLEQLVTRSCGFADVRDALETFASGRELKSILVPGGTN